jgi:hypothetical protein
MNPQQPMNEIYYATLGFGSSRLSILLNLPELPVSGLLHLKPHVLCDQFSRWNLGFGPPGVSDLDYLDPGSFVVPSLRAMGSCVMHPL